MALPRRTRQGATVTWELGRTAVVDVVAVVLAAMSALLMLRFKVSSTWLVLDGGVIGFALTHVG